MTAAIGLLARPLIFGGRALGAGVSAGVRALSPVAGGIRVFGVKAAQIANIALPENAQEDLERKARAHSNQVVSAVRNAARARGAQAAILAKTVEWTNRSAAEKFQVAQITMGGSQPIGRRHTPAYALAFGSEFGSRLHRQFPRHLRAGWWFYRTIEASMAEGDIAGAAGDEAVRQWAGPSKQHD